MLTYVPHHCCSWVAPDTRPQFSKSSFFLSTFNISCAPPSLYLRTPQTSIPTIHTGNSYQRRLLVMIYDGVHMPGINTLLNLSNISSYYLPPFWHQTFISLVLFCNLLSHILQVTFSTCQFRHCCNSWHTDRKSIIASKTKCIRFFTVRIKVKQNK